MPRNSIGINADNIGSNEPISTVVSIRGTISGDFDSMTYRH